MSPTRECKAGHHGRFLPADLVLTALVFHIQHSDAPLQCISYERTIMFREPLIWGHFARLATHMWRPLECSYAASPVYPRLPAGIRAQASVIHTKALQASPDLDHRRSKTHVSGVVGQTPRLGCSIAGQFRRLRYCHTVITSAFHPMLAKQFYIPLHPPLS
jgi:hypothetical protein